MAILIRLFVVGLLSLSVGQAHAQTVCYQWRFQQSTLVDTGWVDTQKKVFDAMEAQCGPGKCDVPANTSNVTYTFTGFNIITHATNAFPNNLGVRSKYDWVQISPPMTGSGVSASTQSPSSRQNPLGCVQCEKAGARRNLSSHSDSNEGDLVCVDECEYKYSPGYLRINIGSEGGERVLASGVATGRVCQAGGEDEDEEDCVSGSFGIACQQPPPSRCGEINGDVVCPDQVPPDECVGFNSGGMACDSDAPAPPKPDNGTPGTPAAPDVTITNIHGSTHYYGPTTVNNSSGDPQTSPPRGGSPTGSGDGGGGTCEGEDCGPGSISGGQTCEAAPICEGDPLQCAAIDQQWRTRCVDMPTDEELADAFGPIEGEEGTGWTGTDTEISLPESLSAEGWISTDCPADITINLGGMLPTVTVPISNWCEWLSSFGVMIMVSAYMAGVRIIIGGI